MNAPSPLRLLLEVRPGDEPLSGSIASVGEPPQPFTGLLELVSRLDDLVGRERAAAPKPSPPRKEDP